MASSAAARAASFQEARELPPVPRLQRSLWTITERFAVELASLAEQPPDWSAEEWAIAPAVVAIHGVGALLAQKLCWTGPAAWTRFLREQQRHTAERFEHTQLLLGQLEHAAREARLALLPLKGAALYDRGIYGPGQRPMADLDLLVQPQQAAAAAALLQRLGFLERGRTCRHVVFERADAPLPAALGEHAGNGLKIELHGTVREPLPLQAVDLSASLFPPRPRAGLNAYRSPGALLNHLLLHAAGAACHRELRLLHLEDIARLAARMQFEDWRQWLCQTPQPAWWAYPPLCLVERYYRCIPPRVLGETGARCQWWLRRSCRDLTLTEVSISHPWVSAFPGIAWARTPAALVAYLMARVLPSAATRAQRRSLAALQPRVSGGSWAQLSQAQRVLRWLQAPQPRHETLEPVRAALQAAQRSEPQEGMGAPAMARV